MSAPAPPILQFLDYRLDVANAQVWRGARELDVRPKALAVLAYLAAHPQRLVSKQELIESVWTNTAVTEWVLTTCMRELRVALGDDARQPRVIETVHGRGYRFIAPIDSATTSLLAATSSAPFDSPADVRLVGRDADLEMLTACYQRACAGERQVVFVAGEAGIGKSALVDELVRRLGLNAALPAGTRSPVKGGRLARGQCIELRGVAEPYLPVIEAFARLCAEPEGQPLAQLMRRQAPAWLVQMPGLLEVAECEALERRLGVTTRERMLREMAAVAAALPFPLLLVLEDLHWSDLATLDLVCTVAQRRDPAPILLIGTYRPVEVAVRNHPLKAIHLDLRARAQCRDLWLAPLTENAVVEYLNARWPRLDSDGELGRVVFERSDGNALFMVAIVDYIAASGAVVRNESGWTLQRDAVTRATKVPPELRQLIAAQVEALEAASRTALEVGSLIGRNFSAALVAAALAEPVVEVEDGLARLAHGGAIVAADGESVWPNGTVAGAYRFNHSLYQSVLRDRVAPARQRQLHERIANALERAYAGHLMEIGSELAFHFEAAGQAQRTLPYIDDAAALALRRGAHREASSLLDRGLAILEVLPRTAENTLRTIRLCMTKGASLTPYGDNLRAEQSFERARELSEAIHDPVQLFQALIALTGTQVTQARLARAEQTAHRLERLLPALPLPTFEFAGSLVIGMVSYHAGDLSEARQRLEHALSLPDVPLPPVSMNLHVVAPAYLAMTLTHLGLPDRGRAYLDQAFARAAPLEGQFERSFAAQIACFVHSVLHDMERLGAAAEQAAALDDFPAVAAVGRMSRGRVLCARGEIERGIEAIEEGIGAYRACGQQIALPEMLAALAEGHAAAGNKDAALACIAEARAIAQTTSERRYLPELHRLEGMLHAAAHDWSSAERSFREALAIARSQGARWWELCAATARAHIHLRPGSYAAATRRCRDELAQIAAAFTEGLDTPDLRAAKRLLDHQRLARG